MLAEATSEFNDCADLYQEAFYEDVPAAVLTAESVCEAIDAGQGGEYVLQKDKSGVRMLCRNTGHSIQPIAIVTSQGAMDFLPIEKIKNVDAENFIQRANDRMNQIWDIKNKVKLPVITDVACDLKLA